MQNANFGMMLGHTEIGIGMLDEFMVMSERAVHI